MQEPTQFRPRPLGARLFPALILIMALAIAIVTTWLVPDPDGRRADPGHGSFPPLPVCVVAERPLGAEGTASSERQPVPDNEPPGPVAVSVTEYWPGVR